jgi:hypothetical protein
MWLLCVEMFFGIRDLGDKLFEKIVDYLFWTTREVLALFCYVK